MKYQCHLRNGTAYNLDETVCRLFGVISEPNGLYYMRARYYDPQVGRFISEDPLSFGGGDVNLMAYAGNNPVNRIDPWGLWTAQVGVSLNGQIGPVNVNVNVGLVVDGHGNVGWTETVGGGVGAGAGVSGGVSFGASNGDCINDIAGPFANSSASLGAGLNGSVEGFSGPGSQGQTVVGGGFTAGIGAGGSWSAGGSQTWVHPLK